MSTARAPDQAYPWLAPVWQTLSQTRHQLSHAILLTGRSGIGKTEFALALADLLLCQKSAPQACGECQVCQLGQAGSLPDIHVVASQAHAQWIGGRLQTLAERYSLARDSKAKPSERLRIDQIRMLLDKLIGTPQIAQHRVALIAGAERMNEAAANALLKMLEEPAPGTWFLLVSDAPEHLPATIRSRCMQFQLPVPTEDMALKWLSDAEAKVSRALLSLTAGGPLQAMRLSESDTGQKADQLVSDYIDVVSGKLDPVAVAAQWPADECQWLLRLLQIVTADLIRIRTHSQTEHIALPGVADRLQAIAPRLDLMKAHGVYSRLTDSARIYDVALNGQLLLEDLLISSSSMMDSSGTSTNPSL